MDERVYWLWMQQAFPPGSLKPVQLHREYPGGVREFLEGGPRLWNVRRDLTDRETEGLRDFSLSQAQARLEYAQKMGWQVAAFSSPDYPPLLREIPNPPCALFYRGTLPDFSAALPVAVAGARKAGPEVEEVARRFGYQLAAGGACVISGGALGVDSAALTGAMLQPGAGVVSVLPVSLDSSYLGQNMMFRRQVLEHDGALVSEYFSQLSPVYGTFPLRNRLITGMARGVVLVQAGLRSGTMLYADLALAQNRDVFVYPGPEDSPGFEGSRELLSEGAIPVLSGEDVLAEYTGAPSAAPSRDRALRQLYESVSVPAPVPESLVLRSPEPDGTPEEQAVLAALGSQTCGVEDLARQTGLAAPALLRLLTDLELEGLVESLPGKRFRRSR